MNTTRTSSKKKAYLHALDHINKYNLNSIFHVPKVKVLNLNINCKLCDIHANDWFKFVCYYVLYVYFLKVPVISCFTKLIASNHSKFDADKTSRHYSFLLTFSDLEEINGLLRKISSLKKNSIDKLLESHCTVSKMQCGSFSLFFSLPLFTDLKEISLLLGTDIPVNNMKMEFTIKIVGNFLSTYFDNKEYVFKNLPFLG